MVDICPTCHLPNNICVCDIRSKETHQIKITTDRKKFRKFATLITGFKKDAEGKEVLRYLKRKLACGGTMKNDIIEIQGEHAAAVKKLLIEKGYNEDLIDG